MSKINASLLNNIKNTFRKEFDYHGKVNWFPPHMIKTRKLISETIKQIDVVIELRDSRAPISTANPILSELLTNYPKKTKVIIFNKSDLANSNLQKSILDHFKSKDQYALFSQTVSTNNNKISLPNNHQNHPLKIIKKAVEFHNKKFNQPQQQQQQQQTSLPNVGKSSFINSIRSASNMSKSAKTGPLPGVTKELTGFKCCDDPSIFIVDSPGIMIPGNLDYDETTLTLALLNCISERIVSQTTLADFLLFKLNSSSNFKYLNLFKENGEGNQNTDADNNNNNNNQEILPTDDIDQFLNMIAKRFKIYSSNNKPDLEMASVFFISQYREGKLGNFTLDRIPLPSEKTTDIIPIEPLKQNKNDGLSTLPNHR
ncbi:hypothetical protein DICPUDRAFT_89665 [Dictyostelium purpureum]|uniref:G domain-containing protein n=1 Tax=Dictyostelium purpureum TaxID=5786 RepID=F0ZXD2_DICPU|nr:uncharacterized protein DICPUDRAFT_89665 [Dictyostelium purpureum]EGC31403.1 hypothetical protein DICPUDRAFT_89665 [Dictyostelium purpureum]|eukprot:XP_003292073.1 hypothetical protein DICPUDRAFT_89665 [Dictyostelium purpureum]